MARGILDRATSTARLGRCSTARPTATPSSSRGGRTTGAGRAATAPGIARRAEGPTVRARGSRVPPGGPPHGGPTPPENTTGFPGPRRLTGGAGGYGGLAAGLRLGWIFTAFQIGQIELQAGSQAENQYVNRV